MTSERRNHFGRGLIAGLALPVVAIAFSTMMLSTSSADEDSPESVVDLEQFGQLEFYLVDEPVESASSQGPCLDSAPISTGRLTARSASPKTGLMPETAVANVTNIAGAWSCGSVTTMVRFESGVEVYQEPGWEGVLDPAAKWQNMIDTANIIFPGMGGYTETVRGTTAMVQPPDRPGAEGLMPGRVSLIEDGVYISVSGTREVPVSTLIEIANSLR